MRILLPMALACAALCATTATAQQHIELPLGTWANDITPDGEVVVGSHPQGGFIWRWRTEPALTVITGCYGVSAVSDDGTVVVGDILDPGTGAEVAGRWTAAGGWQNLGYLPGALSCPSRSNAYDVSGDGNTVVGLSWDGCSGRAFKWTEAGGMVELQHLGSGSDRATKISGNGATIAGFAGTPGRTPAYWNAASGTGFVLDPTFEGEVLGLSEDGSESVGTLYFSGGTFSAFHRTAGGTLVDLGKLHASGWAASATDLSANGNFICGFDYSGTARQAWLWTAASGIVSYNSVLTSIGITGASPVLVCRAMSDDGNVVVGGRQEGSGGPFGTAGFITEFSTDMTWQDLGGGLAGAGGQPVLQGAGPLTAGSTLDIDLTNAPASAPMLAWVSLSSVPFPYFTGTIHANPHVLEVFLVADFAGAFSASATWPNGVPSGSMFWFQFLVGDGTAPAGIALTNALKATTP